MSGANNRTSFSRPGSSRGDDRQFNRGRGGRKGKYQFQNVEEEMDTTNESEVRNPRRPPKHLKGREIGLFYARKGKAKRVADEKKPIGSVYLSASKRIQIQAFLDQNIPVLYKIDTKNYDHVKDSFFKRAYLQKINENINDKLGVPKNILPNESLDNQFKDEYLEKRDNHYYKQMLANRKKLPCYKMKDKILDMVENNQIIIISGETGCGKTTQVAQFILDDFIMKNKGSLCSIICSQPRRISAISVAERVADERAENIGISSGYRIRLEKKLPREKASITFCTTGVILKQMEADICLNNITHLILDEIHERDVLSDFLIALILKVIKNRKDLKIILMSATLNSKKFAEYYNVNSIIEIPGFTYEVKEYYLEDVLLRTGHTFSDTPGGRKNKEAMKDFNEFIFPHVRQLEYEQKYPRSVTNELKKFASEELDLELVRKLIFHICSKESDEGAILVFLTGFGEINALNTLLEGSKEFRSSKFLIIPLHSQMPTVEQKYIFKPPPRGVRKIILSTNIAETSITIDDVVFVIDGGRIKMSNFDIETNQQTLYPEWVSLANAAQRRGRAGRVKPGICFHLFTKAREMILERYQKPEILRKRLEDVVLTTKILQLGKAQEFLTSMLDSPDPKAIDLAVELLKRLNALDDAENLTPLGYHLAKLPISPQMGKMVLFGAIFSCLDPILSVAASLDFKDAFQMPMGKESKVDEKKLLLAKEIKSDHLIFHEALKLFETCYDKRRFCSEYFLSQSTMRLLENMKRQFMEYLYDMKFVSDRDPKNIECNRNSTNLSLVKAIICAGLYPNVVVDRNVFQDKFVNCFYTTDGQRVKLHPKSVLTKLGALESPILVYYLKIKSTADFIHDATMVYPLPLIFFGDNFNVFMEKNVNIISINKKMKFRCHRETGNIIKELRNRLNWFLEYKTSHPGFVNWADKNSEQDEQITTLRAIMELITIEDKGYDNLDEELDE